MLLSFYKNGVCLDMGLPAEPTSVRKRKKVDRRKRGKLTGAFSAASFRRMREYCITHESPGECWGVTLTVPGAILEAGQFKKLVHKLSVFCNHWQIPMVWRCELQQRGQPHLHLVLYGPPKDVAMLFRQWHVLVLKTGDVLNIESCGEIKEIVTINRAFVNGSCHMFDAQKLTGDFRAWRYLVAHASKGKVSQSGWQGRQWGVVCRNLISLSDVTYLDVEDREMYALRRWVRRASSRMIGNRGKHFVLLSPSDLRRMIDYLRNDYFGAPF